MGLEISPLCDRRTINIPQSQIGFITYIIEPTFALLSGRFCRLGAFISLDSETSMFVAREFLPVVLDDDKEKSNTRVSTEKKFKALRTHSLNVK